MTGPSRSSEEFAMRGAIAAWGRPIWPRTRIVHELVVAGERRIDMAFIGPDSIIGVEIKSSRDTLERLSEQMRVFKAHLPLVILAVAPKWTDKTGGPYDYADDKIIVDHHQVEPENRTISPWVRPRQTVTVQLLELLWASEARAIASRTRVSCDKRLPLRTALPLLARALTGDEIVREVCRELRARDAFPRYAGHPASDPPIFESVSP